MKPICYYLFSWVRQRKILKHINSCEKLLDIGCGREYFLLKKLKSKIRNLYGIDCDIEECIVDNIVLKKFFIEKELPYESNKFDTVVMSAVLEHLDYQVDVLQECWRVLKRKSRIIIATPCPQAELILKVLMKLRVSELEKHSHKHNFEKQELVTILENIGFKNIKTESFEFGMNNLFVGEKYE